MTEQSEQFRREVALAHAVALCSAGRIRDDQIVLHAGEFANFLKSED